MTGKRRKWRGREEPGSERKRGRENTPGKWREATDPREKRWKGARREGGRYRGRQGGTQEQVTDQGQQSSAEQSTGTRKRQQEPGGKENRQKEHLPQREEGPLSGQMGRSGGMGPSRPIPGPFLHLGAGQAGARGSP